MRKIKQVPLLADFAIRFATKEVNETKATDMTSAIMPSENCRKTSENILFDTERLKKAGHFLEECRLFLSGFPESDTGKASA